jgi:SpoVK/Ycf46/Vps4 family AAA+-type ATPase
MSYFSQGSGGLVQLTHGEIQQKIAQQKLFGLDELQQYLFRFCKIMLTANRDRIKDFSIYDLTPSILLYCPPNTGKTSLCYFLFDRLKREVTNEINFYTVDIGRMLDPNLGQSSRNLEQIFQDLHELCKDNSSVFLLLDELDSFCMSRSRAQENDGVRRAMTTLMQELDKLSPVTHNQFLVFGITNVPYFVDPAVVRRFSIKKLADSRLSRNEFNNYLNYLSKPLGYKPTNKELDKLYDLYQSRDFTAGDIKALYKVLLVDVLCGEQDIIIPDTLLNLFETGFLTREHLANTHKELSHGKPGSLGNG